MLYSVEQAFVGSEEIRAPLKTPAWEAMRGMTIKNLNDSISEGMISKCPVTVRRKMVVHKNILGHDLFAYGFY